jgi:hypothetical protein
MQVVPLRVTLWSFGSRNRYTATPVHSNHAERVACVASHIDLEIEWETNTNLGAEAPTSTRLRASVSGSIPLGSVSTRRDSAQHRVNPGAQPSQTWVPPQTRSPSIKLSFASCSRLRPLYQFCRLLSPMVVSATARPPRHKGTGQYSQIRTYDRRHCGFPCLVTRFNRGAQMTVPI